MLYESNWLKLQSKKYTPLVMGLFILCWIFPVLKTDHPDWWIGLIFLVAISSVPFAIFFKMKNKLKFVLIGKTKLIIRSDGIEEEYNWLDVERITLNRFVGLYKLKMKDKEEPIYFTPYGTVLWVTGDESDMGIIINKIKKELQI